MRWLLLVLGLCLLAPGAWADPEEATDGSAWRGLLPDPDQGVREAHEWRDARYACRVLDAETGKPVAGAVWIRTPEWIAPDRIRHDVVLARAVTDADGIAHMPMHAGLWEGDSHWLVFAEGYAPAYAYGISPEVEVHLRRGAPLHGRLLDGMGRPVENGVVEVLGGCSHGTAVAGSRTDADGRFSFPRVDERFAGQFWVAGRGVAASLVDFRSPPSLGTAGIVLSGEAGMTYTGTVVDLLGAPIPGVVVRAWNEQRGPVTLTDAAGRFVLEGVDGPASIQVLPPFDLTEDESGRWFVEDLVPGVPIQVRVSPLGVVAPAFDAPVRVRVQDVDGAPVEDLSFHVAHVETGWIELGLTEEGAPEDEDDLPAGVDQVEVPAGPCRVLCTDPFSTHAFEAVSVVAQPHTRGDVVVVAHPRPVLHIEGELPEDAVLTVGVVGDQRHVEIGEHIPVPGSEDVVVRVEIEDRPPFFFPAGPVQDGVRVSRVELPPRQRIQPPAGAVDAGLRDGDRRACAVFEDGVVKSDARGPLTLWWEDAQGALHEMPVQVPAADAGQIVVAVSPGGSPAATVATVVVQSPAGAEDIETRRLTVDPGERVVIREAGWRTLRTTARADTEIHLRWGTATLALEIVDTEGQPVDALVLADGEVYPAPQGTLTVRGYGDEQIRVVVARRDVVGEGRQVRLPMTPGQTTSRRIVLPDP